MEKLRVIVTGSTGMVGEGVMHECLNHPAVASVLVINRRPGGVTHPKLKEIIHADFTDINPIRAQLRGYNACFFCLGVSSIGKSEAEFYANAYSLTLHVAQVLVEENPDMTFTYVSGAGTDSTEQGRSMWARVKGKAENALMRLPFKRVYPFRPGYMHPTPGLKRTLKGYRYITWMYPLMKVMMPGKVSTLADLGQAMIRITIDSPPNHCVEVPEIKALAKAAQ